MRNQWTAFVFYLSSAILLLREGWTTVSVTLLRERAIAVMGTSQERQFNELNYAQP